MIKTIAPQMRAPLVIIGVLAFLLSAYLLLFIREYKEVDQGWSKAALKNRYFAAQKYLKDKTHITWRSHQALRQFKAGSFNWQDHQLGPHDTLIIEDSYGSLSPQAADNVLQWVAAGGHLIYHFDNPYIDIQRVPTDPIVEYMGFEIEEEIKPGKDTPVTVDTVVLPRLPPNNQIDTQAPQQTQPYYFQTAARRPKPVHCYFDQRSGLIALPWLAHALHVHFKAGPGLYNAYESSDLLWQFGDEQGIIAAASNVKLGRITLVNNFSLWTNANLACADNGFLLRQLLGPGPSVVWFINLDAPNLWQRLWAFAPEALIALICALLAWLWRNTIRFGEPLDIKANVRRSFLDHFKAWSNFLWRPSLMSAQISAQRQACLQQATKRLPGFAKLTAAQQIKQLERMTGRKPNLIEIALFRPVDQNTHRTCEIIQALQQLRSHL